MSKPPREIDGARVLEWAWSGAKPFGVIRYQSGEIASEVFGLAICKYIDSERVYRFSCNRDWEAEQDADYESVVEAKEQLPAQYRQAEAIWHKYE